MAILLLIPKTNKYLAFHGVYFTHKIKRKWNEIAKNMKLNESDGVYYPMQKFMQKNLGSKKAFGGLCFVTC